MLKIASKEPPLIPTTRLAETPGEDSKKPSPMMAQYLKIKGENPGSLLFYRMGDFYELFFDDAECAARALNIVLTKRGKHKGEDIPMCGVPVDRADDYLHRLIAQGFLVAICEQIEDPAEARKRGNKSVVARQVVRLVTPGTITEEGLLDPARANCLLAIVCLERTGQEPVYGLASADISTGDFSVCECEGIFLGSEIARIAPSEIVVPERLANHSILREAALLAKAPLVPLGREMDGPSSARKIIDYFGLATLDGLGAISSAEIAGAALALFYIERTQLDQKPALSPPARTNSGSNLEIDAATRANLELGKTLGGAREGSLLAAIDMTVTPGGGRLLTERLAAPLTSPDQINGRLDSLSFLKDHADLRRDIRAILKSAPDLARALGRLSLNRGGPRDLANVGKALDAAHALSEILIYCKDLPPELQAAVAALGIEPLLANQLAEALEENLPLDRRDGGFICKTYDFALDSARALRDESRKVIAELQARYCDLTGSRQLKLKHNHFLGYFIELPQNLGEKLLQPPFNQTFVHRQTMADAMRFSTAELVDLESRISNAATAALERELAIFETLRASILKQEIEIKKVSAAIAVLDVSASLAELAQKSNWTRPEADHSLAFAIKAGRHPVVEAALTKKGEPYIANSCDLTGEPGKGGQIAVITGPNMAGKSTYLRQNALIAILAQMGSFVPAEKAHIGVIDRLFSRVGAADDLARGRSTFMVEMVETAAILNQATSRSLVILDEIGRGTATFDGLSIAWAVMEHLHDKNRSRALFATHFHELTELARRLPRVMNLTVKVKDWQGDVIFLHEIMAGTADRSYGIQVAKLAGLPPPVIARAKILLDEFESTNQKARSERAVADLPLFAVPEEEKPSPHRLELALGELDLDALSPKQALEALYGLKNLCG